MYGKKLTTFLNEEPHPKMYDLKIENDAFAKEFVKRVLDRLRGEIKDLHTTRKLFADAFARYFQDEYEETKGRIGRKEKFKELFSDFSTLLEKPKEDLNRFLYDDKEVDAKERSLRRYNYKTFIADPAESLYICLNCVDEDDDIPRYMRYKLMSKYLCHYFWNDLPWASKNFDCDSWNGSCELVTEIYERLSWGAWNGRNYTPYDSRYAPYGGLGSDTMNSFGTIFRHAVNKLYEAGTDEDIYKAVCANADLQKLAHFTHTVGNIAPVPVKLKPSDKRNFNPSRGYSVGWKNPYFVCDFWDMSLQILKNHFPADVFKSYVDTFALGVYCPGGAYDVEPFFEAHKEYLSVGGLPEKELPRNRKELLPQDKTNFNTYLQNVNKKIKCRGEEVINRLRTAV